MYQKMRDATLGLARAKPLLLLLLLQTGAAAAGALQQLLLLALSWVCGFLEERICQFLSLFLQTRENGRRET